MTEQLEQLIQAAAQMADDDPRLAQARELIRLRVIAKLRQTYPNLDQENCANVIAAVIENLENISFAKVGLPSSAHCLSICRT